MVTREIDFNELKKFSDEDLPGLVDDLNTEVSAQRHYVKLAEKYGSADKIAHTRDIIAYGSIVNALKYALERQALDSGYTKKAEDMLKFLSDNEMTLKRGWFSGADISLVLEEKEETRDR